MIRNYYLYAAITAVVIILTYSLFLMFIAFGNHQPANATNKIEYNSTSTVCIDNKPCVTTICINNDPCHTVTNSTNTDNSSIKRHTIVSPFPQENI